MYGKNGSTKKVEMFSPLFILLAVIAVIFVAVLAIAVQGGASLQARPRSMPVPSSSMEPVTDSCMCQCVFDLNGMSEEWLCPSKPSSTDKQCSDELYEYTDITDEYTCSQKEGKACAGYYLSPKNEWVRMGGGELSGCEITAGETPTPTSTASY